MLISPAATFDRTLVPFPASVETLLFEDLLALGDELAEVDLLVVPLIGVGFDAFDLIERLGMTVFMGRIRVVSDRLADRAMVLRELRDLADPLGLAVDLSDCL
ncbi:MAG: hypothetical protein HC783_16985 [Rhodobacteraceae bacterium]|nr:hypothetical protein [Paracoccaceae bacterium]